MRREKVGIRESGIKERMCCNHLTESMIRFLQISIIIFIFIIVYYNTINVFYID